MTTAKDLLISVVVPVCNERLALPAFHASLLKVLNRAVPNNFEIIYCDDGSSDATLELIKGYRQENSAIRLLALSRNFGKEIAVTAGINEACGKAVITLDADGQHPVELLPEFIARWQAGSKLVIGIRTLNHSEGLVKHYGSKLFYSLFNRFTGMKLVPGATDYRIIDRSVQQEFMRMTERNRITRGLLDWLGYDREYLPFKAKARIAGEASYSFTKLLKLAIDSVVSQSISPLHLTAYIGAFVLPASALLGFGMSVNALLGDPLSLDATGSAYAMVLVLFLIGILLVSQGIIGLYLSHIHTETQNRPLYIIDKAKSQGL